MLSKVFSCVGACRRCQNGIAVMASPVVASQLVINYAEECVAVAVNPRRSLACGKLEVLLENVFEAISAVENRVVGKARWCGGERSNLCGLVSNAPCTAKSRENAVSKSGSGGVEALVVAARIDDGNRV